MPPKSYYSDPKLRDQIKEEIKQSDKGGAPGQWSARKAQFMAQEYKKRGGGYTTDKSQQDESQKHLDKWTDEEWQTKEGSGQAKKEDGTQKRYLPKKAWEKMTEEEKEATDEKKQEESKEGKQFVSNTESAKQKRKKANQETDQKFDRRTTRSQGKSNAQTEGGKTENAKMSGANGNGDDNEEEEEEKPKANTGQKRKATGKPQSSSSSTKKQKSEGDEGNAPKGKVGSKHMDATEPGPRGSADRLPKKGDNVTWKAMPGYVDGTVEEVLTKGKTVDGKAVKAGKDDPKLVLKSNSSGKICVHKPDACFYS